MGLFYLVLCSQVHLIWIFSKDSINVWARVYNYVFFCELQVWNSSATKQVYHRLELPRQFAQIHKDHCCLSRLSVQPSWHSLCSSWRRQAVVSDACSNNSLPAAPTAIHENRVSFVPAGRDLQWSPTPAAEYRSLAESDETSPGRGGQTGLFAVQW